MQSVEVVPHAERPINPSAVRVLYDSAGWWPERKEEQIARILDGDVAVGAWEGERLVGFARAVSDERFRAYIEDVVVDPAYQRGGVGSQMLARLLESLTHIEVVTLFCASDLVSFYKAQGFRAFPSQIVMHRMRGSATEAP